MANTKRGRDFRSLKKLAEEEGLSTELLMQAIEDGRLVAYRFGKRDLSIYDPDWEAFRESSRVQHDSATEASER
jgi:hypothetical protein